MLSFSLTKQTSKNILDTTFKKKTSNTIFEILIDYSLSCNCNVSVMEFWTKFNKRYPSSLKWSQVSALKFSLTFLKIQSEIKKSSQFFLWLLQLTNFVVVFGTRKSLNSPHIVLCRIGSCKSKDYHCNWSVFR